MYVNKDQNIYSMNTMTLSMLNNSSLRKRERTKKPIEQRLLKNIVKNTENGCWEWMGTTTPFGHGRIGYRDKTFYVHRISYEIFIKKIPKNMQVCHKCDNPKCINPDHLFLGRPKDNTQDMMAKKRYGFKIRLGELHPRSTLNDEDIIEIKKKIKQGIRSYILAKEFNVSRHLIGQIKRNLTWKHIKI